MRLNSENVAFGRHETFPLRFSWIPKGVRALERDPKVFEEPDSTVRLGVGRNMVNSIRYWLRASGVIESGSYDFTELGKQIFASDDGWDPYLEDEGTIWLLHWLIASNAELATSIFWFFNRFQKTEFTSDELMTALGDFCKEFVVSHRRPARNTLKSDVGVIPRMYTQSKITNRMPLEEALDSPFSVLKLVEHKAGDKLFVSRFTERPNLPIEILGFAIFSVMNARNITIVPLEDLMHNKEGFVVPGAVFRLSESDFVRKLELLVERESSSIVIRESNGIHQIFLKEAIDPARLLKDYYERAEGTEEAA